MENYSQLLNRKLTCHVSYMASVLLQWILIKIVSGTLRNLDSKSV